MLTPPDPAHPLRYSLQLHPVVILTSLMIYPPVFTPSGPLAFTQYFRYQYGMVYSIDKGVRGRGVPCAAVVQYYCNSMGITGGGGTEMTISSCTKALK